MTAKPKAAEVKEVACVRNRGRPTRDVNNEDPDPTYAAERRSIRSQLSDGHGQVQS